MRALVRYTLRISATAVLLAGCGGSQPPIGAPGAMPPSAYTQTSSARSAGRSRGTAEFAYVADLASYNVSAYAIASNGALTQVKGSPFAAGYDPSGVAIGPMGKFAYVSNGGPLSGRYPGNVSAYSINARSGALTQVKGSPFAAEYGTSGVAVNPSEKFAYATNYNTKDISAYAIAASSGALTQVKGSPFPTSKLPDAVAVDPTGKFVYATSYGSPQFYILGHVSAYVINARSGSLTRIQGSPFKADNGPDGVTVDPSGKFAYVVNYDSHDISAYSINARTGALKQVKGSPFAANLYASGIAIDPTGRFAYVGTEQGVYAYTIASSGALTPVQGSPFAAGTTEYAVAVDPAGKFVYVVNPGSVYAFTINKSSGALTMVQGSPFGSGMDFVAIATCRILRDRCVPPPL
jgi:6-phosphogluconolactonase